MAKLEIGSGFLVTALAGFDLLGNTIANAVLLVIALFLIGHGSYEVLKPRLFLKRTVEGWLIRRHWVLSEEPSPNLHFGWHARNPEHEDWPILVSRTKNDQTMITFSAHIPMSPMDALFDKLNAQQRKLLEIEIRQTLELQNVGFGTVLWPLADVRIQTALATDGLSEHVVDMEAKRMLNTILAVRAGIQRRLVEWG